MRDMEPIRIQSIIEVFNSCDILPFFDDLEKKVNLDVLY